MPLIQNRPNASWLERQMKNGQVKAGRKGKENQGKKKGLQRDEDDQSDLSLRTRESDQKRKKTDENNQR
jgi:hypothetical protein